MTESAAGGKDAVVLIPGSMTDFAKALREIIGALRDVGGLITDVVGLYDKHQARGAAKNISVLSFTPDGSRRHLERIAAGTGTPDDLEAIGRQMAETAGEVEASIRELGSYRERLREKHGMAAAAKLDDIVHGPSGKQMLRMTLLDIVEMGRSANTPPDHIPRTARQALQTIDGLNRELIELHDMLLPPKGKA